MPTKTFGRGAPKLEFQQGRKVLHRFAKGLREGVEIQFGIPDIDAKVGRLRQGDFVLMAGPPHGFKTQQCISLVWNNPDVNFLWASPDEGHEFVLQKMICAKYGLTQAEFDTALTEDENVFDDDIDEIESHVAITEESEPQKLTLVAQQAEAVLGEIHCMVFDYVEQLSLGMNVPPKLAWLKRFGRENNILMMMIHQSVKAGLDLSITPNLGMLQEAGHKEAFLVLWAKRPYIDPDDAIAVYQDENQPSVELWVLKHKRGRTSLRPIVLAIEEGNRVVQWARKHTIKARGVG